MILFKRTKRVVEDGTIETTYYVHPTVPFILLAIAVTVTIIVK